MYVVDFAERTSFGAVKTLSALCAIYSYTCCFSQQSASILSKTYFTFFTPNAPLQYCAFARTFYNVKLPCYCCVTWYETVIGFFLLILSRGGFCGAIPLYVAKVWAGGLAVPLFLVFLYYCISHVLQYWNLVGGIQSSIRPGHHQTSARPCV